MLYVSSVVLYGAYSLFLLLVPELVSVVVFGNVIKVSLIVHYPTSKCAECVFVPFSFSLSPLLFISWTKSYASVVMKVNSYGNRLFIFFGKSDYFAFLQTILLCSVKTNVFGYVLKVTSDNLKRN